MPKVSAEHLEARRRQILAGAQRAFAQHGYDGATVAILETETGLSRGAIFNYFDGKLDLFAELARDVNRRYTELMTARGLDGAIRAMAEENPDWIAVLVETQARLRHDPAFQARADAASDETSTQIVAWFRARQEDGTFRDDLDALELARFAAMTLNGLALRVVSGNPTDVDALLRLLHDALAPRK